MFTLHLKHKLR